MAIMCPQCSTRSSTPHGRTECWQPMVIIQWFMAQARAKDKTPFLYCPICHYSEEIRPETALGAGRDKV